MSEEKPIKLECSSCGVKTPHTKHGSAKEEEEIEFDLEGETLRDVIEYQHLFLQCQVCGGVSLRVYSDFNDGEEPLQLYPPVKDLSGVPQAIRDSYSEARKVKKVSPTAFLVLVRRALEFLCKDQNAKGADLKSQIEDLGKKDIIPKTLSRMSQALRYFGNLGAHATDAKIGFTEVGIVEDFFLAIVEYVYIAPEKLKKAEEHAEKKRSK